MNINSKRLGIYVVIMLVGTAIATALRSVACVLHMDYELGYFTDKSLSSAADIIIWGTALACFTYIFIGSKAKLRASFSTAATYIPTGILGVAILYLGMKVLSHTASITRYPLFSKETLSTPQTLIGLLVAIFSVVSVAHFFYTGFITESKSDLRALFSIGTIAFLALYSILIYLDSSLATNAPIKTVNQMAYLFSAIFFLYEARISLGREMWRAYAAFGLMASAMTAYSAIPSIITYYVNGELLGTSQTGKSLASLEEYMATLALFIFILARLLIMLSLTEGKKNRLVSVMADFAKNREKETEESLARHQQDFASKQMTFFELDGAEVEEPEEEIEVCEIIEQQEEQPKEITLSDDVIYESIFGIMPEKDGEESETEEEFLVESTPKIVKETSHTPTQEEEKEENKEKKDPEVLADETLARIDEEIRRIENENKE